MRSQVASSGCTQPPEIPDLSSSAMFSNCKTQSPQPGSSSSTRSTANMESQPLQVYPPSPAAFVECKTHMTPRRPCARRPLQDVDIESFTYYGSETDSDVGDDEVFSAPAPSRAIDALAETPMDDEQEPEFVLPSVKSKETFLPNDFFDFKWTQFPTTSVPPASRREPFWPGDVGPTSPCQDAYDMFVSIWNREIMDQIAQETNRYAQQMAEQRLRNGVLSPNSRICEWKDTTPDELYTYFGIVLAMGIVIKSKLEEYWGSGNNIFVTPYFSAYMTLRRFQLINNCLHFVNNEDMCAEELSPSEAKLFKIEPIIRHLNSRFQDLYIMDQNVSLDESLLQWKGWLNINQFIRNKAATVGIKTYEVCESRTGYLWRFEVHAHKKTAASRPEPTTPLDASTPAIVLRLLNGLEHKGHTVWMDNFYNSPALARVLKAMGFDVVGTLRTNRQFVPRELTELTKNNMRPGQIAGLTSGDVDILVWRDHNRVATISTYHGNATATSSDGNIKPIMVLDYNVMMGGVDKKDQLLSMYPIERKRTSVWYKKLFRRLLNVSVLNAYIITKKSGSSLPQRSFRRSLVCSLLSRHSTPASVTVARRTSVFEAKTHYIDEHPVGQNKSRLRRKCCVCKVLTRFYCVGCDKTVCMSSCFVSLHS